MNQSNNFEKSLKDCNITNVISIVYAVIAGLSAVNYIFAILLFAFMAMASDMSLLDAVSIIIALLLAIIIKITPVVLLTISASKGRKAYKTRNPQSIKSNATFKIVSGSIFLVAEIISLILSLVSGIAQWSNSNMYDSVIISDIDAAYSALYIIVVLEVLLKIVAIAVWVAFSIKQRVEIIRYLQEIQYYNPNGVIPNSIGNVGNVNINNGYAGEYTMSGGNTMNGGYVNNTVNVNTGYNGENNDYNGGYAMNGGYGYTGGNTEYATQPPIQPQPQYQQSIVYQDQAPQNIPTEPEINTDVTPENYNEQELPKEDTPETLNKITLDKENTEPENNIISENPQ